MENNSVIHIPKGWTYLSHGTNTNEWQQDLSKSDSFTTTSHLSCVDVEHLLEELNHGSNSVNNYAQRNKDGEPFEIRCLIYQDCKRHIDKHGLQDRLTPEEIKDIFKYYSTFWGRHECVPKNTKLIKIATSEKNELTGEDRKVYWFVPEKYYEHYKEDIEKYPDKTINISTQEPEVQKPSWDLSNWNLTPKDVQSQAPLQEKVDPSKNLEDYYKDVFDVENISKIDDPSVKQSLFNHYGISQDAKIDVFLTELNDIETGDSRYVLCMMDKKGKIKELKLPIAQEENNLTVDSKPQLFNQSNGQTLYSPGKQAEGLVSWKLNNGLELTVFQTKDGKVNLGKSDSYGRPGHVESVNSTDIMHEQEASER